jgi:tetratricopeptide (TPR) repeat protein
MFRVIYILIICLFSSVLLKGQEGEIQKAYQLYLEKDLAQAAELINEVVTSKKGSSNAMAWHVRGFIYKDMYAKANEMVAREEARDKAINSFMKSMDLDVESVYAIQNKKALRALALSYYNNAVDLIDRPRSDSLPIAEKFYDNYKRYLHYLNPDTNLTSRDIEFYLAMSTAHRHIFERDREKNEHHDDLSKKMLKNVLEIDPENFSALYSLAVSYYNKGVYNLQKLPEAQIYDIVQIEAESMRSIEVALPFMYRAYEVDESRIEAVRGLKVITFNLHREEESKMYEEKEQELKQD